MEEALPSLLLLGGTVLLCEAARASLRAGLTGGGLALELVCAFQLCACTQELWLLAAVWRAPVALSLALTYLMTLVHGRTCTGAVLNPTAALQQLLTGRASLVLTGQTLCCQLLAAWLARLATVRLRTMPVSALHGLAGASCNSGLRTGLWQGAAVELACAFSLHSTVRLLPAARPQHRPHLLALVIAALVYAGGHLTGAMFNPALALSLNFFCKGNTIPENMFVYWLGPVAGMILSVALFEHVIPIATRSYNRIMGREAEATGDKID